MSLDNPARARVDASMEIDLEGGGELATSVAVSRPGVQETMGCRDGHGNELDVRELSTDGGRVQIIDAPAGTLSLSYTAEVDLTAGDAHPVTPLDELVYTRPSRYCPSDRIAGLAAAEFASVSPSEMGFAVEEWLHSTLSYVPGATDAEDDALHALLTRQGVCRDYAHLGIALCRARGVPARYTSVYAPGLDPMDFHAVFEIAVDGVWNVFDGTRLAPRQSLVRIASGRDAADTALVSPTSAVVASMSHDLTVTTVGDLPVDDRTGLVSLA